jgi:hypothetical protein
MTPSTLPPFQLTGRRQFLYQSLAQKSAAMGELYESAIRAFQVSANSGRIFLAAHSIREMTKDLPKVLDVPVLTDHGRMRDRLDALEKTWNGALASNCSQAGAWTGEVDPPLRQLLLELPEFFTWRSESDPKMRDNATALFRRVDPAGRPLPEPLEKRRAKRWIALHDYFNRTAHRSATTEAEFVARLDELERILMDSLSPQPSEDFSVIDAIFLEDRADA